MTPLFTRRHFLSTSLTIATAIELRKAAFALGLSADSAVCQLTPEQEIGPYYVANELLRMDIAENKPGIPLTLRLAILDARTCKPLPNAAVDIWHCDAQGIYSGYTKASMGPGGPPPGRGPGENSGGAPGGPDGPPSGPPPGPPPDFAGGKHKGPMGPPQMHTTDKLTFLRGIQITGEDGAVQFRTIFPGVYPGRTNHIHFKVHIGGHASHSTYKEGHVSHIGQVFFPEETAVSLMRQEPYAEHKIHRTTQAEDGVFNGQNGSQSICILKPVDPASLSAGFHAELIAAVDPTATPAPVNRMGGPGMGGPDGPPPPGNN